MLIYFAAPLFCQAERDFNLQLTQKLEERDFSVFLPQRDGINIVKPPYNQMTQEKLTETVFSTDLERLLKSDIFLLILDGRVPDEGACVELGIAYGRKHFVQREMLLVGLHTDFRPTLTSINFMIRGALDHVFKDDDSLIGALEKYRIRTAADTPI